MDNSYGEVHKQRGHMRSASLENAKSLIAKNTLGLPIIPPNYTGTLKSKNEQRKFQNKFGSQSNIEDYVVHRKAKFQNLRSMFEVKSDNDINRANKQNTDYSECLNIVEVQDTAIKNDFSIQLSEQGKHIVRPIAFKPIPFEPDYSIPNRLTEYCDRYGSTPSLVPPQGPNLKFGSTSDLRNGYSYCSNLYARRRCSRSLKVDDSLESVRQTSDSETTSRGSTLKSSNKFLQDQFDMTPSPSDSGVSDLEAALKDRDSELAYLRQTMEHNEKAIFKVHKDKEVYWEHEVRRIKSFYENQQRENHLKIKKLEQMLTLQSFQFKQNKLRHSEDSCRLQEQFGDLSSENELLKNEIDGLRSAESMLKDRTIKLEEQTSVMEKLINNLKRQLEENEWTVCQKNGEIALLKTQLREANVALTSKDHEMVHLKTEAQTRPVLREEVKNLKKSSNIQDEIDVDLEISQLNRIIILKDQVILAMTNELGKLRKELSDLAIYHEYGEEPTGKYTRLKYKIDNLTNLCNSEAQTVFSGIDKQNQSNQISNQQDMQSNNLDIIINCLKNSFDMYDENYCKTNMILDTQTDFSSMKILLNNDALEPNEIRSQLNNLPDVTLNNNLIHEGKVSNNLFETNVEEHKHNIEDIRNELGKVQNTLEHERKQWAEEKEKVICYQRQLQMHYINMYQKIRELEDKLSKKY